MNRVGGSSLIGVSPSLFPSKATMGPKKVILKKSDGPPPMWPETHKEAERLSKLKAPKLEVFSAFRLTNVSLSAVQWSRITMAS
jgi:hypothetical protein